MSELASYYKGFKTESARWARFGPYYAMFPVDFAFNVIDKYSKRGDKILDPFSGRGTSIFAGSILGRQSTGIEINPLGWIYGSVKLHPANHNKVLNRLKEIYDLRQNYELEAKNCSDFFKMCFCEDVLKFLLSARTNLKWKESRIDRTLMAFVAYYLHGGIGKGLSNQMRSTRAFAIQYSMDWWIKNNLVAPPNINAFDFLSNKIHWRYGKGFVRLQNGSIKLGDSCDITRKMQKNEKRQYSLLFTSPPYCGVTDYFKDQWLRLWLLGGNDFPKTNKEDNKNKFDNKIKYTEMLNMVFGNCAKLMKEDANIYVRTDCREFTRETTINTLRENFPNHKLEIIERPIQNNVITQTMIHGNFSKKPGEVDIILTPI